MPDNPPEEKPELEDYKNKLLRALADFDNYKKRAAQELESFVQFANEELIKDILPALDNFNRAFATAKSHKDEFIKGVALVKKQLEDSLKKFGVEEVKALGLPYDPTLHEAIMQKESDKPENTVIEVVQNGYTLKGRLLRPAMVIVAKNKEEK